MIHPAIQVAVGGGIGAVARYGVNVAALRVFGSGFPVATLLVNVIGSFVMGVLVTVLADRGANHLAPLLMTGVLGGFTTFSAFSLDTVSLWTRGAHGIAAVYVVASVALSLAALVAGIAAARAVA
ncbi:MAG: fluoride efflux transporter CrcB [Paracoccus denitrificans]|nr:MAG: fluoride efflux transporter CrcB [Paracoccus denitrificans]PZO85844.1 MAG: fluoride efflux transporter CrcB [Paracoccus denitrificans]